MALDVRILLGSTTYYLVNSSGSPTPGGSPASISTTPYSIQAAQWTQTAAARQTIYAGGPPFGVGARPVYTGFDNVTETIEIGIAGSSSDNVISLIRFLRQILNTALFTTPAILYWLPNGATSPAYFEIYSADVQEVGDWQNPSAGFTTALCRVTWTRSAFGGRLTTPETVINAVSYRSAFSGSPLCYSAMSAGSGDLVYDGQPLNVTVTSASGSGSSLYIGSIHSVVTDASTQTVTTSSPTGAYSAASDSISLGTTLQSNLGLKARLFMKLNGFYSGALPEFQASVSLSTAYGAGAGTVYLSPWVGRPAFSDTVWDMGSIPTSWLANSGMTTIAPWLRVRSTTGASTTVTIANWYVVLYYTMCRVGLETESITRSFTEATNRVCLPLQRPVGWAPSTGTATTLAPIVGTPPRYVSGASLLVHNNISYANSSESNTTADSYTVTATHAPLYTTLRGAG